MADDTSRRRAAWAWAAAALALAVLAGALVLRDDAPGAGAALVIRKVDAGRAAGEDVYALDPAHVEANAPALAEGLRHAAGQGRWSTDDKEAADAIWQYLETTTARGYPYRVVAFEGARFEVAAADAS